MSRVWTQEELQAASAAMKSAGHMGYEEFTAELGRQGAPLTNREKKYLVEKHMLGTGKTIKNMPYKKRGEFLESLVARGYLTGQMEVTDKAHREILGDKKETFCGAESCDGCDGTACNPGYYDTP